MIDPDLARKTLDLRLKPLHQQFDYQVAMRAVRDETILREMLGRWVSEMTPILILNSKTGDIIGLGAEEDHGAKPTIILRPDVCDCPLWGPTERCSPTLGRFNCRGDYVFPVAPPNCWMQMSKGVPV